MEGASIGRSRENTIYCNEDILSREHAKIFFLNDNFYIKDLGKIKKKKSNSKE
jgi:pSer/pThr/pTyr-binding forkhead associated (FHA) protein